MSHLYVFFGRMFVQVFCSVFDWVLCFFVIELYELFLYFGDESFVSHTICKCFLPFCRLFFVLFLASFAVKYLMSLNMFLFYFCFYIYCLGRLNYENIAVLYGREYFAIFSSSSIMSCPIFKTLSHFKFAFVYGVRVYSNFIILHVTFQLSQHHLQMRLSFLHCVFLPHLLKINRPQICRVISVPLIHISIFVPIPFCSDYHSFVALSEVCEGYGSCFDPLPQDCFCRFFFF